MKCPIHWEQTSISRLFLKKNRNVFKGVMGGGQQPMVRLAVNSFNDVFVSTTAVFFKFDILFRHSIEI